MRINVSDTFGWSGLAWRHTTYRSQLVKQIMNRKNLKILELGASSFSQVAFEFDQTESKIMIGFYAPSDEKEITEKLFKMSNIYQLKSEYNCSKIDALSIKGKYDVIIMKSVLGGIFRNDTARIDDYCCCLASKNLEKGGLLITIDNGKSIFERFLKNHGSRKSGWHFFSGVELLNADEQVSFGFFSCFELSNRLGIFGRLLETLLYLVDRCLNKFFKFFPTVICSVYRSIN